MNIHIDSSASPLARALSTLLSSAAAAALLWAMPAPARGAIYLTETDNSGTNGSIGEFTNEGAPVGTGTLIPSGVGYPTGLALSGPNLLVSDYHDGRILEYNATTGAPVGSGMLVTGLTNPYGIAVSGGHLFVADSFTGVVGEYNLNGTVVNPSLITGLAGARDIVESGGHLFITIYGNNGKIVEYNLDGTQVGAGPLVSGLLFPVGLAASGDGAHLFVVTNLDSRVYEFDSSTGLQVPSFSLVTLHNPEGITMSGDTLFVTSAGNSAPGAGALSEYILDPSLATVTSSMPSVITGLNSPLDVAVDNFAPVPEPSTWAWGLALIGGLALPRVRRRSVNA